MVFAELCRYGETDSAQNRPPPTPDVVAVAAMERRAHNRSLAGGAEQLGQNGYAALHLAGARGVVGAQQPVRAQVVGSQLWPDSPVQLAREHLLLLTAPVRSPHERPSFQAGVGATDAPGSPRE